MKPVVVLTGPSQAGKDTILAALVASQGARFHKVRTATSRDRRQSEDIDAMTWLRKQHPNEDFEAYVAALRQEYDLLECTPHSGSVYGLPRMNLSESPENAIPVINTDVDGISSLADKLAATHCLVSFIVCPARGQTLVDRIVRLGTHVDERIADASRYVDRSFDVVNFAVRNSESSDPGKKARLLGGQIVSVLRTINISAGCETTQ